MKQEIKQRIFCKYCKIFEEYMNEYLRVNKYENENDKRIITDMHKIIRFTKKTTNIFNTSSTVFELYNQIEILKKDTLEYEKRKLIYDYFALALEETNYYIEDYIDSLLN